MGQISAELTNFRNSVGSSIGNMRGISSDLQGRISQVSSISNNAINGISSCYSSSKKNMQSITNSTSSVLDGCASILSSLSSVDSILSSCDSVISKIARLDEINNEIAVYNQKAGSSTASEYDKSSARGHISTLNQEFDRVHSEAETTLNSLKGAGGAASIGSGVLETVGNVGAANGYTFGLEEITVNGKTMKCYIYRPKDVSSTEKLPVQMYMYGMGFDNKGTGYALSSGMGKMISEGKVNSKAIYIIPYVQNGRQYENKSFRDDLAQLTLEVARQYNGDEDRISLSGNSYGAVVSYRLVDEHPGQFTAIVASCGAEAVTDAFKGVKVYNYTGRGTGNHTDFRYIKKQTEAINEIGGEATYKQYDDQWAHSNVANIFLEETVDDGNGNQIPVYEAALRYKRNKG